jgi:hypothetical protein
MPASTARTGGESAPCTCHAAMRLKTPYTCQYLLHNAGVRLRSAHCRRSIQTSRLRIRSLKLLSAGQVMRCCETVAARRAHSCAHVHAHAPSSHARVSALCECAGCASVSAMWAHTPSAPCRAPRGGSLTRVGSHAGWDSSSGTLALLHAGSDAVPSGIPDAQTQHSSLQDATLHASLPARTIAPYGSFLQAPASTHSTLCEYQEYRCGFV